MNASRDDAAGKIRVQSNRGGGCQWRREVGPLGRRKAATLTFVEAWNQDNISEMRERTQQPWAKGTDVVAKKCSQCGNDLQVLRRNDRRRTGAARTTPK